MYLRIVTKKQNNKAYKFLHLVESYRVKTPEGFKVRQRSIANFGNINRIQDKDLDNIFSGLCRIFGRELPTSKQVPFADEALSYGHIHALLHIWKELKWDQVIAKEAKKSKTEFDLEKHIKVLVLNRLCDPKSKLALLDWLEHVYIPGVEHEEMRYENLLRAMDWLIANKEVLERKLTQNVLTLFDDSLELVFYDVTSVYFEVSGDDDFRKYGYSRDHRGDLPQVVVGLVMTKEGLPVAHYTFPGNTADKSTFSSTVRDIRERFGVKRCVVVADRGMMSEVSLEELEEEGIGFLMSINMRQNATFQEMLGKVKRELEKKWERREGEETDVYYDGRLEGRRLVVAYNEERALESRELRKGLIGEAEEEINSWVKKLNSQDLGKSERGRRLTDQGVLLKAHDLLKSKGIDSYFKLLLDDEGLFHCYVNRRGRNRSERLDGILGVVTTEESLSPGEVIRQYKGLQELERCFRTLKSSLDIRPVYHWKERRIRAHIFLCVMALQVERAMKMRLKRACSPFSPEKALYKLSSIHALKAGKHVGLTTLKEKHREVYKQLEIPFPQVNQLAGSGA